MPKPNGKAAHSLYCPECLGRGYTDTGEACDCDRHTDDEYRYRLYNAAGRKVFSGGYPAFRDAFRVGMLWSRTLTAFGPHGRAEGRRLQRNGIDYTGGEAKEISADSRLGCHSARKGFITAGG